MAKITVLPSANIRSQLIFCIDCQQRIHFKGDMPACCFAPFLSPGLASRLLFWTRIQICSCSRSILGGVKSEVSLPWASWQP